MPSRSKESAFYANGSSHLPVLRSVERPATTKVRMTEIPVIELPVAPQAATIEMDSALGCCRLLLQLSQGHESNIQARTGQADLSSAVRTYGAANGIDLRLERLSLHKSLLRRRLFLSSVCCLS